MSKPNPTTNSGRCLYMRDDKWAEGHFDFLLDRGHSEQFVNWVKATKEAAKAKAKVKSVSLHYPQERR